MIRNSKRNHVVNIDDVIVKLTKLVQDQQVFSLKQPEVQALTVNVRSIFLEQPMLLQLDAPIQICGDTHGQFKDLLTIFRLFGLPGERNYLFLGDYVDRVKQSLQSICLLFAYKIKYPNNFFLLRGNHESSELNKMYGFYDQCKRKASIRIWKMISDCFNFMPIAAVVGSRIFCVHGGLSPMMKNLAELNGIKRPIEAHGNKIVLDMLWSDPSSDIDVWSDNLQRGTSYYYGQTVVDLFLNRHELDLICRSHQVVEEGYQFVCGRKVITIFSAPNYCSEFVNVGAIIKVNADLECKIQQFEGQPLQVKKRTKRSVTPIHHQGILKQIGSENIEKIGARKLTKISKAELDKLVCEQHMTSMSKQSFK